MRIRYTKPARQDLIEIQDYIARDDEVAAHRLARRLQEQVGRLAQHPHLAGTRERSVSRTPCIVIYRIKQSSIDVLTIIHSRRRWPP